MGENRWEGMWVINRKGYALASVAAQAWGLVCRGRRTRKGELVVISGMPNWAFGRGATCVGNTVLCRTEPGAKTLAHEDVHRQQWLRYGLAFIPMYFLAGRDPLTNRFEIEAGLEAGGYHERKAGPAAESD